MKIYYTYVLKSEKDFNYYVGYSEDVRLRFEQHKKGLVESTKARRPLKLIYFVQRTPSEKPVYLKRMLCIEKNI